MKKSILKKFRDQLQKITKDIDNIGCDFEMSNKEKENESGEALWSAQNRIEEAIQTLDEFI